MPLSAVIFDCDGTLVDSEPLAWRAWRDLLAGHGYELRPEDIELTRGRGWPEIHGHFAEAVPEIGDSAGAWTGFSGRLFALLEAELTPFDDAIGTARELHRRGIPVAVASSSPRARLDATLRAAGLHELFDVTVAGDEVARGKPAPDLFLAAAERLGVAPADCVAVEDSPPGVAAAVAAGMTVVAVARKPEHRADLEPHLVDELTPTVVEAALRR
jgi:HAD superfamily hydrolase (TIGR01509 family)